MSEPRKIIIGLDGVPHWLLKDLADKNVMPTVRQLIANGSFSQMSSSLPEVSSVAWSSIITGANPAEHGIFGFTGFKTNSYQLCFPNFTDLKVKPFWLKENKKSIILNVPSTYPAGQLNGSLIAGFVEPGESIEQAVVREVIEEVGVGIKNIKYFGSQPWPFPDSLMLGFTAEFSEGEIKVDGVEIEEANWFSIDEIPNIPKVTSISGKLIRYFIAHHS